MTAPAEQEPASPLAAMISDVADGKPLTHLDRDILKLKLVDKAQKDGASWAVIARALKYPSGREAKRDIHKLRDRVKRAERLGSAP
jgi:hypothetical protein